MVLSQIWAEGEAFEREDAFTTNERLKAGCQEHIEIKVEPTIVVYGEVAEEIDLLDFVKKGVKDGPVLRILVVNKCLDSCVVVVLIVQTRIQQLHICHDAAFLQLKLEILAGLDYPSRDLLFIHWVC